MYYYYVKKISTIEIFLFLIVKILSLQSDLYIYIFKSSEDGTPSDHVACTVEMSNLAQKYEVAVIDEIQVIFYS